MEKYKFTDDEYVIGLHKSVRYPELDQTQTQKTKTEYITSHTETNRAYNLMFKAMAEHGDPKKAYEALNLVERELEDKIMKKTNQLRLCRQYKRQIDKKINQIND